MGGGGTKTTQFDPYAGTGTRELFKVLTDWLQPQIGQGVAPYPGTTVPEISPLQQAGFDVAGGYAPIAVGGQQYYQDVLGQQMTGGGPFQQMAGQTLGGLMQPYDPASATRHWQQAFVDPAMQNWQRDIMPLIKESYVARGAGESGALNRALARSGQELGTGLSSQLANILYSGEQAQLGRQQTGVGQAMQMAQLPGQLLGQAGGVTGQGADLLGQMMNIGTMQRGFAAEPLQEELWKWQQEQPYQNPYLQFLPMALQQPGMQAFTQQQGPGMFSQMMPALGSFLGSGGSASVLGGATGSGGLTSLTAPMGGVGSYAGNFPAAAYGGGGLGSLFGGIGSILGGATSGIGSLGAGILGVLSDKRFKENFGDIDNALDKIEQLEGMTYRFKNKKGRSAGIIAQDLEKVLPEGIIEHKGVKFIKLDAVIGLLVNGIKELNAQVKQIMPTLN